MVVHSNAVIIEARRAPGERSAAPVAIIACEEVDWCRFRRLATPRAGRPRRVYNAGFLELVHANCTITLAGPVLGAPQAVLVLEKLISLGSRTVLVLGWCGSLHPCLRIGNCLVPASALSEEGTSAHYPGAATDFLPHPALAGRLVEYCRQQQLPVHTGAVWTTDAPLRETAAKVRSYGEKGILAVEMEMSALFRVAAYRKVRLAGLLVTSDELFTLRWRPGFRHSSFKKACRRASEVILDFCAGLPPELIG
jgi:uridine phosphorylase